MRGELIIAGDIFNIPERIFGGNIKNRN